MPLARRVTRAAPVRSSQAWLCIPWLWLWVCLGSLNHPDVRAGEMPGPTAAVTTSSTAAARTDGALPQPLRQDLFEGLLTSPPFTRSLGVSDSLILTGIAWYDHEIYATLLDTKTQDSLIVSPTPNAEGWRLVEVKGDRARSQTWTARIQIPGGQVVAIHYQPPPPRLARSRPGSPAGAASPNGSSSNGPPPPLSRAQVDEAQHAAVNYKEGFSSDGYPKQPPPEIVAKLSRLSVDQRADINRQMFENRNRGLGMEERRKIYEDLVNRAGMGRR